MKRTFKVITLVLVLVLVTVVLVACGGPKGEYKDALSGLSKYTFSGRNYKYELGNITSSGTFKIEENETGNKFIVFTDSEGNESINSYSEGEEDGVKYIKIGSIRFVKPH